MNLALRSGQAPTENEILTELNKAVQDAAQRPPDKQRPGKWAVSGLAAEQMPHLTDKVHIIAFCLLKRIDQRKNVLHPEITPSFLLILTYVVLSFLRLTFFLQSPLRVGPIYWAEWNNRCHLAAQLRQTNSLTTPRGCRQCVMRQLHSQSDSHFGGPKTPNKTSNTVG